MQETQLTPCVILDTETTGLPNHPWARVIELGAVALDHRGNEVSTFTSLVRPINLDDRATKALECNHLDPAELRRAPSAADVWASFCAWGSQLPDGPYATTAWRVNFDRRLMSYTPGLGLVNFDYCLWEMVKMRRPQGKRNVHLAQLCAELGLDADTYGTRHRALTDARLCGEVLRRLLSWPVNTHFMGTVEVARLPNYAMKDGTVYTPSVPDDDIPF